MLACCHTSRSRSKQRLRDQVLLCVHSQCHCVHCEDKDSIEETDMVQRAAQDTLTDLLAFVPSSPFIHTTATVFSVSPLPALFSLFLSLYHSLSSSFKKNFFGVGCLYIYIYQRGC